MTIFVFDFDSTLVEFETLDFLAEMTGSDVAEIANLTNAAMEGRLDFGQALRARVRMMTLHRADLIALTDRVWDYVTPSVRLNPDFFAQHEVYVVSGGFKEVIDPLAVRLGIPTSRVFANEFLYDENGYVIGVVDGPLAAENGKPVVVSALRRAGQDVVMVGDGWSDYQVLAAGAADRFYAFTEIVARERVVSAASHIAESLDKIIGAEGL